MAPRQPPTRRLQAERDAAARALDFPDWNGLVAAVAAAERAGDEGKAKELRELLGLASKQAELTAAQEPPFRDAAQPPAVSGRGGRDADRPRRVVDPLGVLSPRHRRIVEAEQARAAAEDAGAAERFWYEVDRQALADTLAPQAAYRRSRYEQNRPAAYTDACYAGLLPQQDPDGKISGWLASGHKTALVTGPRGHGKSWAMYAIGNDAAGRGQWVEAWPVAELVQVLAALAAHEHDEVQSRRGEQTLHAVKTCDLLILDDLGREEVTGPTAERWRAHLSDIFAVRAADHERRTVFAVDAVTRGNAIEVLDRYGARTITRLRDDCVGVWVEGDCLRGDAAWDPF